MNLIAELEAEQIKALGKDIPEFAAGDTVRVGYKVTEGSRSRVQSYEGVCIGRNGGSGIGASFTVRKISFGEGVERVFPLYATNIDSLDVVRRGKVRRAKLYYLRDRRGKSARIEIVDANACTSGRSLVDEIGFSDTAALPGVERTPWLDWGKDNYAGITFENLLGNAWKFTSRTEGVVIEFGASLDGDVPVYFVRDNGAGFDMQFADRLFGAFQRLHSEREFPGTGIGLATVHRIIRRHGGRIWVEAAVGQGAAFHFSLPPDPTGPRSP